MPPTEIALKTTFARFTANYPASFPDDQAAAGVMALWAELLAAQPWVDDVILRRAVTQILLHEPDRFLPNMARCLEYLVAARDDLEREARAKRARLPPPEPVVGGRPSNAALLRHIAIPSSAPADASASPLPDVIRLTVPAQYDGEDWFTFNADKTAEEVPAALRDRYPHLASVTLDESGGWLRVIERPSWDAPVERYRLCGLDAGRHRQGSSEDDLLHVRLVRLGCDDPGPEEPPIVPPDEREPDELMTDELIASEEAPSEP
jgi:hypothetical protein